jgi:hypothetical protein
MNPFIINFAFVGILTMLVSSWLIIPAYNLHIVSSNSSSLKVSTQKIIDRYRSDPDQAILEISAFNPYGLKLHKANYYFQNDFLIYNFEYNPEGLFTNKFFTKKDYETKNITLTFMIDKQ